MCITCASHDIQAGRSSLSWISGLLSWIQGYPHYYCGYKDTMLIMKDILVKSGPGELSFILDKYSHAYPWIMDALSADTIRRLSFLRVSLMILTSLP